VSDNTEKPSTQAANPSPEPGRPEAATGRSKYSQHQAEIYSSLDIMLWAEKDWDGLPPALLALDEPAKHWIAAALASEGIGKVT
jgi:hypothetical protein